MELYHPCYLFIYFLGGLVGEKQKIFYERDLRQILGWPFFFALIMGMNHQGFVLLGIILCQFGFSLFYLVSCG